MSSLDSIEKFDDVNQMTSLFQSLLIGIEILHVISTSNATCATFSLPKWKSTSICFILAWNTGFAVKWMGPKLLNHKTGGRGRDTSSSLSQDCTYVASAAPFARALYSASVLDHETVGCFRALNETKLGPKKTRKLPVERMSLAHPTESASMKTLRSVELYRWMLNPVVTVPLIYLSMRMTASQCTSVGLDKYWHN